VAMHRIPSRVQLTKFGLAWFCGNLVSDDAKICKDSSLKLDFACSYALAVQATCILALD
jgi:hypothetical protein